MTQILVVDDSNIMRLLVSHNLAEEGRTLQEASDGVEALALAKTVHFDLIVTDIHMPEMNGIELIENLRRLENHHSTPIIVLTTESNRELKASAKKAGANAWIEKPFEKSVFLHTMTNNRSRALITILEERATGILARKSEQLSVAKA